MKTLLFTIQSYILRFVFGSSCYGCKKPGPAICKKCLFSIPLSLNTENVDIYGIYEYGNAIISHSVWNLKYRHKSQEVKILTKNASGIINEIISDNLQNLIEQEIVFIPIPQYKKKVETRGFNQSYLMAKWLSLEIKNSSIKDILIKKHETIPQSHLSNRSARLKNISNTMKVKTLSKPPDVKEVYIIIDDVTTTGATFLEAKRALKTIGIKNILCIALAHGYKK